MKIYHHNDLDGRCAAFLVRNKALETNQPCTLIECDYKDEVDIDSIELNELVVVVDFSFKPDAMEKIIKKTNFVTWLDHHKTAFEYKYSKELSGIRDNAYSGCELAWKFYYPDQPMPRFVELIGDMDKWAWTYGDETKRFCVGMELYDYTPTGDVWIDLLKDYVEELKTGVHDMEGTLNSITNEGTVCSRFRDNICKKYLDEFGFETEFEEHKCLALGFYMFGSLAFGDKIKDYDMLISFEYDGKSWECGLYSEKVDVSEIAKKFGGGGHKGAAGFMSKELPFKGVKNESD